MRSFLAGPPFALPQPVDVVRRRWARLAPRVRVLLGVALLVGTAALTEARVRAAQVRWGGPPVAAWVAVADSGVGQVPDLERVLLPPRALPAAAFTAEPPEQPLSIPLPAGAVMTTAHVSPTGPAVGQPAHLRLVPVPVDDGWGVAAGTAVDVWVREEEGNGAAIVANARAVVDVRTDEAGDLTALVALSEEEVAHVTSGLARGAVWLSHVPRPLVEVES